MTGEKKENRLIVADAGWAESLPEWLLEEVEAERMIYGLAGITNPDSPKVGDAETVVYLFTLALRQPIDAEHTNIYIYLSGMLMEKREMELPDFIKEQVKRGLTEWEQHVLNDLKNMIYTKRGGEINHPVIDMMRCFKNIAEKDGRKIEKERKGAIPLDNWVEE